MVFAFIPKNGSRYVLGPSKLEIELIMPTLHAIVVSIVKICSNSRSNEEVVNMLEYNIREIGHVQKNM